LHTPRVPKRFCAISGVRAVFWDNVATMHSASPADYKGGDRLMHRGYAYIDSAQQSASAAVSDQAA